VLEKLTSLDFFNNDLEGSISTNIGQLQYLQFVDFRYNDLTGTIPSEIGLLENLEFLYFSETSLTGTLPAEICQLYNSGGLSIEINNMMDLVCSSDVEENQND